MARPKTSQYLGVNWDKRDGRWRARIAFNKKHHYIGSFIDEADAHQAYISYRKRLLNHES